MSADRPSGHRWSFRPSHFAVLAAAVMIALGFGAGVLARPLVLPDPTPVVSFTGGFPSPTPIPSATPTPYGETFVSLVLPPTATPFVIPPQPYLLLLVSSTPLRAGPGVHYHTLAQGMRHQGYFLLGISDDTLWYAVQLPGVAGNMAWVERRSTIAYNATGLPLMDAPAPAQSVSPYPTPGKAHLLVMVDSAIREGPGVTYRPIRDAAPGEWFRLAGSSADGLWLAVSVDGLSSRLGWLRADACNLY